MVYDRWFVRVSAAIAAIIAGVAFRQIEQPVYHRGGDVSLQKGRTVILLNKLLVVDFNERVFWFLGVFLQVVPFIRIDQEHVIIVFFGDFLRCFLIRQFFGDHGDGFVLGAIDAGGFAALIDDGFKRVRGADRLSAAACQNSYRQRDNQRRFHPF